MRLLLLFCLLLCMHGTSSAQLTVSDVRQSTMIKQGTLESATLSVRPKGLYMECGLYLTFSARGVTFNTNGDSLEVRLKFDLPEGSTVHDSWLWVGDEISKARIFDRWTASTIYEGIVKRRSDPSILFKNSATRYQLQVFPMKRTDTRRVKITWLQPATFDRERTTLDLPFDLLRNSFIPLNKFNLLVWTNDRFKVPSLLNQPNTYFEEVQDTLDGGYFYRTVLNSNQFTRYVKLAFASPMRNGYFLNTGASEGEKFYQLAVMPDYFIPGSRGKKVALCLDYQLYATNGLNPDQILVEARNTMLNNLITGDSFNLFCSGLTIRKAADRWMPAHPDTIRSAFNLLAGQLAQYSNLPNLLPFSIEWVKMHGNEGFIVLATNDNQFINISNSNTFLNDVLNIIPPTINIYTLNFADNTYYNTYYLNGAYYYANGYLLSTLSAQTNGAYVESTFNFTQFASFSLGIETLFSLMGTYTNTFDLNITPKDGFCYARLNVSNNGSLVNLDRPILQVGKYLGSAPFNLVVSGALTGPLILSNVEVPESEIETIDTLSREIWYGKFVQTLEDEQQSTPVINNILFNSLNNRVLSRYTAFLCLEDSSYYCDNCTDETQLISTDELSTSDSLVNVYPNPFETRTTIQIKAMFASNEHPTFEIYDLKGRLVYIFNLSAGVTEQKIEWDGQALSGSESPAGVYFGLMKMKDRTVVIKLVKI